MQTFVRHSMWNIFEQILQRHRARTGWQFSDRVMWPCRRDRLAALHNHRKWTHPRPPVSPGRPGGYGEFFHESRCLPRGATRLKSLFTPGSRALYVQKQSAGNVLKLNIMFARAKTFPRLAGTYRGGVTCRFSSSRQYRIREAFSRAVNRNSNERKHVRRAVGRTIFLILVTLLSVCLSVSLSLSLFLYFSRFSPSGASSSRLLLGK